MYSDMSMRIIVSSSPNRNSASVRASSALPTPEGPRKMNEPVGRLGSFRPARDRLGDHLDRWMLTDHALVELLLHAHERRRLGLGELEHGDPGPQRDDVGDLLLADRRTLGRLTGLPLVGELAL